MPTTFTAIYLGNLADIDTVEGNYRAENAQALVGSQFGGPGNALLNNAVTWSAVGNPGRVYEMNLANGDRFSIDGGPPQTFDGTSIYNATITYTDGTTADISAVIAQDTDGNTYLAPEFSPNSDQAALSAGPIQSIRLNSLAGRNYRGLTASRETWDLVTCFTQGTRIRTQTGDRPVDSLKPGDLVATVDHGLQPLRWIGRRTVPARGAFAPVLFRRGVIGNDRDLLVSQQHRMLVRDWRVELNTGHAEALAPAKHLVNGHSIALRPGGHVTYLHLLFDRHELVWSEGCISESFHPGTLGWSSLDEAARAEVLSLFPELAQRGLQAFGPTGRPALRAYETMASVA
ncbi:Hint domain-containing protein [Ruegeria intermedia]|uniref:Hint domain-containing protein n=1 Tax=Ruegeria intermedia TaxID=996115 RepID=A0A1M4TDA8_9RHOB|nr:Hint domain-containing protein [Ruegeria intermedia]SHE42451.1 Hint domain-containing protein [Ruegeria intermedia]